RTQTKLRKEEAKNRPSPLALISQDSSTSRLLPPQGGMHRPRGQNFKPLHSEQYSREMRTGGENAVVRPILRFDNLISDSVTDEFAHRVQLKLTHDVGAVCLRRFHTDAQ